MKKSIFLLIILLINFVTFGADVEWNKRYEGANVHTNLSFEVTDGNFTQLLPLNTNFIDKNMFSYVRLGIHERVNIPYTGTLQTIIAHLEITPYSNSGTAESMFTTSISVEYNKVGSVYEIDASDYRMAGKYKFKVKIASMTINGSPVASLPDYIFIQGGIKAERYYVLNTSIIPNINTQFVKYLGNTPDVLTPGGGNTAPTQTEEIYLNWDYVPGAEFYDLEWTWVDNYSVTSLGATRPKTEISMTELEFKNNSTRIRTSEQGYRIPQIFAKGYLIYRVRAVGRWIDPLNPSLVNKEKYGLWSSGVTAKTNVGTWPHVCTILQEHEQAKNWQYQATYAEDGKKKEVTQYFDGSLRGRQTVTRINSQDQSVVGETIYDNEGRGVVQILPVPQTNPAIRYYEGVNMGGTTPYSHKNFDWEDSSIVSCTPNFSDPLSTSSGAGEYYSANEHTGETNWQQYVPESNGYAFTQVEYTPDNTGRIRRQSGVGNEHKIGSGRETIYYYSQPSQSELNRLFGYKVGFNSRYKKNMVVDANGQVSISYLDAQGRVIATGMAGENPDEFAALESASDGTYHHLVFTDLLNKSASGNVDSPEDNNDLYTTGRFSTNNDGLQLNTQLNVIEDNSTYNFNYSVQSSGYSECDSTLLYPYVYDLTLSVVNDCGVELFTTTYDGLIGNESIGSAMGDSYNLPASSIIFDKKGTYTLNKKLEINEQALNNYVAHYLNDTLNPCLISDFTFDVNLPCDFTSCADCAEALGTLESFLIQAQQDEGPGGNYDEVFYTQKYNALKNACLEPCEVLSSCDVYYNMMLMDVSPNGQYCLPVADDPISILTNNRWRNSTFTTNIRDYLDQFGNVALMEAYPTTTLIPTAGGYQHQIQDNGTTPVMVEPWQLTEADFVNYFQDSWAEALVDRHPEYPLYAYTSEICTEKAPITLTNSDVIEMNSENFDAIIRDQINTHLLATSNFHDIDFINGLVHPIFDIDPYFSIDYNVHATANVPIPLPSNTLHTWKKELMKTALEGDYKGHGISLFEFSVRSALCGNANGPCSPATPTSFTDPSFALLSVADRNLVWQLYKSNYLSLKGEINQMLMDMYGFKLQPGIFNGCIGAGSSTTGGVQAFTYSSNYFQMVNYILYNLWGYTVTPPSGAWNPINHPIVSTAPNFQLSMCSDYFNSKEIRFTRMAALYNEGASPENVIAEGSATAAYEQWQQTGLCPLTVDVERLINALAVGNVLTSSTPMVSVNEMVPSLFYAISGGYPSLGTSMDIIGNISSNQVTLTFDYGQSSPVPCITIGAPTLGSTTLNWSGYGSSWFITSASQSYPVPSSSSVQMVVRVVTSLSTPNDFQEYIITYTTSCMDVNACQTEYAMDNSASVDCDKEEQFETALLGLLQQMLFNGVLNNSSVVLTTYSEYTSSILVDYLGPSAVWNGTTGTITGSIGGVSRSFSLGYGFSSTITMITSMDIFNPNKICYISVINALDDYNSTVVNYNNAYCYQIGASECSKLDFSCPCEETQAEEIALSIESLLNDLFGPGTSDPSGLQPQGLLDMTYLFNGVEQEITNYYNKFEWVSSGHLGCLTYSTHWWPAEGEQIRPDYPCLTIELCHGDIKSSGNYEMMGVFNLVFNPVTLTFTADVLLSNGSIYPAQGTISCIVIPDCNTCLPSAIEPVSCTALYPKYEYLVSGFVGSFSSEEQAEYIMDDSTFCAMSLAYIFDAYEYYINELGPTSVNDELYVSISEFGATPLGYSNDLLMDAVDAYMTSGYLNINSSSFLTWNQYVGTIYMAENPQICPRQMPPMPFPDTLIEFPCNQWESSIAAVNEQNQQDIYLQNKQQQFIQAYIEGAMSTVVENFSETHLDKEYHYTLYYYDRAGNLIQTVPPKGVNRFEYNYSGTLPSVVESTNPNSNGITGSLNESINAVRSTNPTEIVLADPLASSQYIAPPHTFETNYRYNSLNQLVYQITPDGGESRFAYDKLGRLIMSQNALQLSNNQYSYTRYDWLGRVSEVGEMTLSGYQINDNGRLAVGSVESDVVNASNFPDNISSVREEVTRTIYDELLSTLEIPYYSGSTLSSNPVSWFFGTSYQANNTRNRIVGVLYLETLNPSDLTDNSNYHNATFYDYDVHGNVSHMIQVNNTPFLVTPANQNIKHVEYEYDLVSGNVNKVIYQRSKEDQMIHRYSYDDDNRITITETSNDGFYWEKDAKYFYYDHGPLARTELGEKKVQSLDYAYTIQGWLKSVNGEKVDEQTMMGHDGKHSTLNSQGARDAFGFSLSYYNNDYAAATTSMLNYSTSINPNVGAGLYNGNIRTMTTALSDQNETALAVHQTNYGYDQLNRIKSMTGYNRTGVSTSTLSGYSSSYSYDENGNLETLKRFTQNGGTSIAMDDFAYHYTAGKNQLEYVSDAVTGTSSLSLGDIQPGQLSSADAGGANYQYDAIGQLIKDRQENIVNIGWTVTNKVKEVEKTDGTLIRFDYDAMGNRIAKHEITLSGTKSTFYVLDAQGNVMGVYDNRNNENNLYLSEHNIYGSSRLGQERPDILMTGANYIYTGLRHNEVGDKRYELSNHLGNVLEVVTDRKLPVNNGSGNVAYYTPDVVSYSDYFPFGMLLPQLSHSESNGYRYSFNGMEKDDEVKQQSGTSYDFGARMYDPRVGRWLTIDPKASKYPMDSPYMSFGNNPIICIDPDGKEKIVVVGSENRSWNLTFVLPGMKMARALKREAGDEKTTLLLFKAGYSDGQMKRIQKYMNKKNVAFQVLTSSDDLVNYVNNKSVGKTQSGRKEDPITDMRIYAHGKPGEIMFGYHQPNIEANYSFTKEEVTKLQSSAFSSSAEITSYACRTGAGAEVDWTIDTDPEKSLAQDLANHLGITVYAYQKRSDYAGILPSANLLELFGITEDKTYDKNGGSWDTDKAIDKVNYPQSGITPTLSPGRTEYKKDKKPASPKKIDKHYK